VRKQGDPGELEALQASLAQYGLLEPILVQALPGKRGGFRYRLICGFRRTAAAKALGWTEIPARVIQRELTPDEIVAVQLTENLQREGMRVRDVVQAIAGLRDAGRSIREVAAALGMGETTVRLYAQIGDVLHRNPKLWPYFDRGLISVDHFRAATRIMTRARERAGVVTQDPAERARILAQAETVFVAMLERLAQTQPLTVKRVSAEVVSLLQRAGLEPQAVPPSRPEQAAQAIIPAVLTSYERMAVDALDATQLERLIVVSEHKLEQAKARLSRLADASA
jgi:ParB family chromosome partitioning protein